MYPILTTSAPTPMDEELGFQCDWPADQDNPPTTRSSSSSLQDQQEEPDNDDDRHSLPSRNPSNYSIADSYSGAWPQSYKHSMDMFASLKAFNEDIHHPTSISLGTHTASSSSSSLYKRPASVDPILSQSLLSLTSLRDDEEEDGKKISHFHGQAQRCSSTQSVLNGFNVLCGIGILSIPNALKAGWMGLIILFLFGAISCYTGVLLKRCLDSSPEVQTYPDVGQTAFGKFGRLAVAIVLYVELYASCVEYITLMGDNLASVFPNVQCYFCGIYLSANYVFSIISALTVLPTVWLRNLSLLSYLSAGGVVASFVVVLCLLWVGVVDHVGFHPSGTTVELSQLPIAIGLYAVCYTGHSVFPNIYTSMEKPSQFPTVLIVCFTSCWLLYTGVAVCGFLMFGDALESQFTLNMPPQLVASKIAVWTTVVNPLTKYTLTITPVALALEELFPSSQLRSYYFSVVIRTVLVISTLVIALMVPFFDLVMALIGSFSTMLVALIFPCACYLKILRGKLSCFEIGVCISIIIIGFICCCIGSYSAIIKMVHRLH